MLKDMCTHHTVPGTIHFCGSRMSTIICNLYKTRKNLSQLKTIYRLSKEWYSHCDIRGNNPNLRKVLVLSSSPIILLHFN
ncbi:hypothetical protein GDO81_016858 [Engystomops pustulosus]|uniref:Uncharacterized protein n=1 Tax=Engystomops pustulosus TaxID=76066 RepID=A0AAV7AF30_ENGPU|nr:hypothetical protein GDO81_016858 [Engystomops pustulosus]